MSENEDSQEKKEKYLYLVCKILYYTYKQHLKKKGKYNFITLLKEKLEF